MVEAEARKRTHTKSTDPAVQITVLAQLVPHTPKGTLLTGYGTAKFSFSFV